MHFCCKYTPSPQASNITTTDSTPSRCYDERGHEYNIPTYCWSSQGPASMIPKSTIEHKMTNADIKNADQPLALKVQVNPGDRNFVVSANTSNSVAELKALICAESIIVSTLPIYSSLHLYHHHSHHRIVFINLIYLIYRL